jgi:hypothetical protein
MDEETIVPFSDDSDEEVISSGVERLGRHGNKSRASADWVRASADWVRADEPKRGYMATESGMPGKRPAGTPSNGFAVRRSEEYKQDRDIASRKRSEYTDLRRTSTGLETDCDGSSTTGTSKGNVGGIVQEEVEGMDVDFDNEFGIIDLTAEDIQGLDSWTEVCFWVSTPGAR